MKRVQDGESLDVVLWDIQQQIAPFSDRMIQVALDSLPDVVDRTITAIANTLEILTKKWGSTAAHNMLTHFLGFDFALDHEHVPGTDVDAPPGFKPNPEFEEQPDKFIAPDKEVQGSSGEELMKGRIDVLNNKYNYLVNQISEFRKKRDAVGVSPSAKRNYKNEIARLFNEAQPLAKQLGELRVVFKKKYGYWY